MLLISDLTSASAVTWRKTFNDGIMRSPSVR
jgi:hypothetical protein